MANFKNKSRTTYNEKADNYDYSDEGRFTQKFKDLLLSIIILNENCKVLDVACGNGSFLMALNKKTPINGYGIDIAEKMIDNAIAKNPDMEFQIADCEVIPFQNETMDIITVCAAYHHFPDVAAFASEVQRLLKPNGMLYIADMYLPAFWRILINPLVPLSKAGDVKFYSPKEIVKNFEQLGFIKPGIKISGNIQIISMQKQ
jgi:ubiquinone/menaquinone biosynthesis C-methylase UbiE